MTNYPVFAFIKTFQSRFLRRFNIESLVPSAIGRQGKWGCLWVAMGLALALPAKAGVIYQTDFSGAAGTLPASWTSRISGTGGVALNGDGQLVYTGAGVATAYWLGDAGPITGGVMADARVTSVVQWPNASSNNTMSIGVLGRVQDITTSVSQGYFVGLYRNSSLSPAYNLIIAKDPNVGIFGSILGQVGFTPTVGTNYRLEATFFGDELTANLYDASGENKLATVSITDTAYGSGVFGVRGRNTQSDGRQYIFDNYTITAVPEPSSVAMLVGAGAALGFIVTRKKSRGAGLAQMILKTRPQSHAIDPSI